MQEPPVSVSPEPREVPLFPDSEQGCGSGPGPSGKQDISPLLLLDHGQVVSRGEINLDSSQDCLDSPVLASDPVSHTKPLWLSLPTQSSRTSVLTPSCQETCFPHHHPSLVADQLLGLNSNTAPHTVQPWANYLTSLSTSSLICKVRVKKIYFEVGEDLRVNCMSSAQDTVQHTVGAQHIVAADVDPWDKTSSSQSFG